jgi:hypothetical protein
VTVFQDLSDYQYRRDDARPGTKNVGWLGGGQEFERATPTDALLRALWGYCKVSVVQMRGIHECEFCSEPSSYNAEREGEQLLLGAAEIRVFSDAPSIFAAPTLIYHYVSVHHYRAPEQFIEALLVAPGPPARVYFEKLEALALKWNATSPPSGRGRFRLGEA